MRLVWLYAGGMYGLWGKILTPRMFRSIPKNGVFHVVIRYQVTDGWWASLRELQEELRQVEERLDN